MGRVSSQSVRGFRISNAKYTRLLMNKAMHAESGHVLVVLEQALEALTLTATIPQDLEAAASSLADLCVIGNEAAQAIQAHVRTLMQLKAMKKSTYEIVRSCRPRERWQHSCNASSKPVNDQKSSSTKTTTLKRCRPICPSVCITCCAVLR